MNRLFPLPIYTFVKTAYKNGGLSFKGLRNLPSWLIKTILFEPLRWIELTYNKKISKHTLTKDPIFILGFYRSGTSFMHQFMTQDDRLGYHTNFQMIFPDMMLSSEKILSPFFDFICRLFNLQDPVHRIQMSFKFPGEEDAAMTTGLNPMGAHWGYFFPKIMMEHFHKYVLFENIPESEIEKWKKDFTFLIKKISLANQGKQLVLKSPPNTARIKLLLSLYPKAKFVLIHRNPYEVYASNKRFWKVTNRIYALGPTQPDDVNGVILDTYEGIMNRYFLEKDLIPDGQLIEIPYQDFIQNPMENMQKIYEMLHLDNFSHCENTMKKYVERQKSYVRLKHELPSHEREIVTKKLKPFLIHWDYPLL
ncbi:sulfotransferase [bacterium]|nr:sulfotransferase [bacterium]